MEGLIEILIWLFSGISIVTAFLVTALQYKTKYFWNLVLENLPSIIFVSLIGSARIAGILDPSSIRGIIGLVAIVILSISLGLKLNRFIRNRYTEA